MTADTHKPALATGQDVRYCYRLLLRREPTAAELALWLGSVARDRLGLDDLRRLFVASLEYQLVAGREFALHQEEWSAPRLVQLPGFGIYIRPNDIHVGAAITATNDWEPHVRRELLPLLTPGAGFVDVGANVGYFTLLAAGRVGPAGRVEAFEPNPDNRDLLARSLAANGFANVTVHPAAAGEREGALWFKPRRFTSLIRVEPAGGPNAVRVRVVPLDAALADAGRIDVIKVDTDGAEPAVLRGARGVIRRHRPALFLECHPGQYRAVSGEGPEGMLRELRGLGYDVHLLTPDGRSAPCDADEVLAAARGQPGEFADLVAYPR